MKKMRKILAVLMTLAMVMGLGMTSFAEEKTSATITVNNADGATLSYVQIIVADQTTKTGWAFATPAIEKCFTDAYENTDAQVIIQAIIDATDANGYLNNNTTYGKALSNVASRIDYTAMSGNTLTVPVANQTSSAAGVYAIKAVDSDSEDDVNYTYNNMAAYVGFGTVNVDASGNEKVYDYPSLMDVQIAAKKSDSTVEKTTPNDADKVVAIGDVLEYKIELYVPYVDENETNRAFYVTDKIDGAEYYLTNDEGDNRAKATVMMGEESVGTIVVDNPCVDAEYDQSFTVDLGDLITVNNIHAGKKVVITYTVKVKEVDVNNQAAGHVSGEELDNDEVKVFTGQITLLKYDVADTTKAGLEGAGFKVYNVADTTKTYLTFVADEYVEDEDGKLVAVPGSYTYNPDGEITEVFTGEDGTVTIKGLNVGTYHFDETTAPKGYSINEDGKDATISQTGEAAKVIEVSTDLADTKLSALPSTGGIGTTIFTIGGCAIMIAAAYMFLRSRKEEQ